MMKKIVQLFCLFAVACSISFGQVKFPTDGTENKMLRIELEQPAATCVVIVRVLRTSDPDFKVGQQIEVYELKSATGVAYGFTAPAGEYIGDVVVVTDKVPETASDSWVKHYSQEFSVKGRRSPGPVKPVDPDNPPPDVPDPGLTGLAREVFDLARAVSSPDYETEARNLANVYRSVANRAKGMKSMTPQDMLDQITLGVNEVFTEEIISRWEVVKTGLVDLLIGMNLKETDREGHIKAWSDIADGLEAAANAGCP